MQFSNKTYDAIKYVVQIVIPAFVTLYIAVDAVLTSNGLPGLFYPQVVTGIIAAVATFLGTCLHISSNAYSGDGTLKIDTSDDSKDIYRLALDTPVEDLAGKKSITLTVEPNANLSGKESDKSE